MDGFESLVPPLPLSWSWVGEKVRERGLKITPAKTGVGAYLDARLHFLSSTAFINPEAVRRDGCSCGRSKCCLL